MLLVVTALAAGCAASVDGTRYRDMEGVTKNSSGFTLSKIHSFDRAHKFSFSKDGSRLGLLNNSEIRILNLPDFRELSVIKQPGAVFLGFAFSPDASSLAAAYREVIGTETQLGVSVWNTRTAEKTVTLKATDRDWRRPLDDLSFSPDGRLLASNLGGAARLWDAISGKELQSFASPVSFAKAEAERALLSPDGKWLAVFFASQSKSSVVVWNLSNGKNSELATDVDRDWSFSSDSKLLAITATADRGKPTQRSVAEVWEVATMNRLRMIEVPSDWRGAYTVAFSPDARLLAIGGYKSFGVYAIDTGKLLVSEEHGDSKFLKDSELHEQLSDIEFSPDGRWLITGANSGTVKLWQVSRS